MNVDPAVRLGLGGDKMTSVVHGALEERHLMYSSGVFLVHPGANLVSDLQIFAAF